MEETINSCSGKGSSLKPLKNVIGGVHSSLLSKACNFAKVKFFTGIFQNYVYILINLLLISRTPNYWNIFQWLPLHLHLSMDASTIN